MNDNTVLSQKEVDDNNNTVKELSEIFAFLASGGIITTSFCEGDVSTDPLMTDNAFYFIRNLADNANGYIAIIETENHSYKLPQVSDKESYLQKLRNRRDFEQKRHDDYWDSRISQAEKEYAKIEKLGGGE